MEQKQVWKESKLTDYLLYDSWQPYNAWCVLAGLDYHSHPKKGMTIESVVLLDNFANQDYKVSYKEQMICKVDRLRDFWNRGDKNDESHSPSYFIEWAISKRMAPEWLDWAIENKLYIPEHEVSIEKHPADEMTNDETFDYIYGEAKAGFLMVNEKLNYPQELDAAIQAWQAVSGIEYLFITKETLKHLSEENDPLKKNMLSIVKRLLSNREHQTLLIIIAALAKEAKVNISKSSKAGELIANMTQGLGVALGATTVENKLKEIGQALESRAK